MDFENFITSGSMTDFQRNAISVDSQEQTIQALAGTAEYNSILNAIKEDKNLDWDKKMQLIQRVDAVFGNRLEASARIISERQEAQIKNSKRAGIFWFVIKCGECFLLNLPEIIKSVMKK